VSRTIGTIDPKRAAIAKKVAWYYALLTLEGTPSKQALGATMKRYRVSRATVFSARKRFPEEQRCCEKYDPGLRKYFIKFLDPVPPPGQPLSTDERAKHIVDKLVEFVDMDQAVLRKVIRLLNVHAKAPKRAYIERQVALRVRIEREAEIDHRIERHKERMRMGLLNGPLGKREKSRDGV
jgi:hypothetical protein